MIRLTGKRSSRVQALPAASLKRLPLSLWCRSSSNPNGLCYCCTSDCWRGDCGCRIGRGRRSAAGFIRGALPTDVRMPSPPCTPTPPISIVTATSTTARTARSGIVKHDLITIPHAVGRSRIVSRCVRSGSLSPCRLSGIALISTFLETAVLRMSGFRAVWAGD